MHSADRRATLEQQERDRREGDRRRGGEGRGDVDDIGYSTDPYFYRKIADIIPVRETVAPYKHV